MIGITRLLCGQAMPGDNLHYRGSSSTKKPIVVWNFTRRCNLRCIHCYADAKTEKRHKELSTAEAIQLIDSLADYEVPRLLFSGGEPLLREDFSKLSCYAADKGLEIVISTNGTLITPSVATELKNCGISYVGISIDGTEAMHDKFRGKEGAFQESLRGINNCREIGLKVGLRFTVTKHNYMQIDDIFDILEKEDIRRCCFYHLVYSGRGKGLMDNVLTPAETRGAMDKIFANTIDLHQKGHTREIMTVANYTDAVYLYMRIKETDPERAEEVYKMLLLNGGCSSGVGVSSIDSGGEVHADQFWTHYSFGNVKKRSFADIWEDTSDPLMKGLKDKRSFVQGRCAACRYFEICGGNMRVRAEAVYKDVWAPDPACYLTDEEIGVEPSKS